MLHTRGAALIARRHCFELRCFLSVAALTRTFYPCPTAYYSFLYTTTTTTSHTSRRPGQDQAAALTKTRQRPDALSSRSRRSRTRAAGPHDSPGGAQNMHDAWMAAYKLYSSVHMHMYAICDMHASV
jgi:hypothetical protein